MPRVITPKGFGAPLGLYSHGMAAPAGEIVVVAGQVGVDARGEVAGADVAAQTVQALENVRAVVEAAGAGMRDIIRLQTFLVSADDIAGFMRARQEVFPHHFPDGVYPPNTLLVVSRLVRADLRVEIEAMAVRRAGAAMAGKRAGGKRTGTRKRQGLRAPAQKPAARRPTARRR
jgi:enamine deaminase RidA (YjgF/YER057c/UK114 family)